MKGKLLLGILLSSSLFASSISPVCQNAYYKGIKDSFLFESYQNSIQIPNGKWWVVIDVSGLTNADRTVIALKLKENNYNPVLVMANGRTFIVAYTSNSYFDAKGVAKALPIGKGIVIKRPKVFQKLYFAQICETDNYIGWEGMKLLVAKLEQLGKENLDAVKYAEFEKHIKAIEQILNQPSKAKENTSQILEELFGGGQQ